MVDDINIEMYETYFNQRLNPVKKIKLNKEKLKGIEKIIDHKLKQINEPKSILEKNILIKYELCHIYENKIKIKKLKEIETNLFTNKKTYNDLNKLEKQLNTFETYLQYLSIEKNITKQYEVLLNNQEKLKINLKIIKTHLPIIETKIKIGHMESKIIYS